MKFTDISIFSTDSLVRRLFELCVVVRDKKRVEEEYFLFTAGLAMGCRVGLRWHFRCGCTVSKSRQVLGFSSKKSGDVLFYFFRKVKK